MGDTQLNKYSLYILVAVITLNVVEPPSFQGSLQECSNDALWFRLDFANSIRKGPGRECTIFVETEDGSAVGE